VTDEAMRGLAIATASIELWLMLSWATGGWIAGPRVPWRLVVLFHAGAFMVIAIVLCPWLWPVAAFGAMLALSAAPADLGEQVAPLALYEVVMAEVMG